MKKPRRGRSGGNGRHVDKSRTQRVLIGAESFSPKPTLRRVRQQNELVQAGNWGGKRVRGEEILQAQVITERTL